MSTATKILLGAALLYLIDMFLPWNSVDLGVGIGNFSINGWHGIGVITGLLVIGILVVEGMRAFAGNVSIPPIVSAGLAAGVVLFTLLKIVVDSEFLAIGAWIGIILALALAYGGYMRFQESKAGPAAAAPPGPPPGAAPPPPPPSGGFTS